MLQIRRPLTRINLLESSREIVSINSSINGANLSQIKIQLSAANLIESLVLRIRDSHISKVIIAQTKKKGRQEMYVVENIHLWIFLSSFLDYMSRKTRIVKKNPFRTRLELEERSRFTLISYEVNRASLSWKYKVYILIHRHIMSLHIDDVLVFKLARKICRIYSELIASLYDLTIVSKTIWWQIHIIENKSDETPLIKMRLTLEKYI